MSVVLNARTKNTLYVGGLETEVHGCFNYLIEVVQMLGIYFELDVDVNVGRGARL